MAQTNQQLMDFLRAVNSSTDLQDKIEAGADLVALGLESGFAFSVEDLEALRALDLDVPEELADTVSGGGKGDSSGGSSSGNSSSSGGKDSSSSSGGLPWWRGFFPRRRYYGSSSSSSSSSSSGSSSSGGKG